MQDARTEKHLRIGITYNSIADLPPQSKGHCKDAAERYSLAAAAGYEGIQGGDPWLCSEYGLALIGCGVVPTAEDADPFVERWRALDAVSASCIAGYGYESDAEMDDLVESILSASVRCGLPVFIETHRASITQDAWRTEQLTRRIPEVRFNGDFSHWFTGQEMPYGDFEVRLERLSPVMDRIRFLHGRIGSRCCMQIEIGDGAGESSVPYFRRMWSRAMRGFLDAEDSGCDLWFCPELLGREYQYAHVNRRAGGNDVEQSDRWTESQILVRLAKECFLEQLRSLNSIPITPDASKFL